MNQRITTAQKAAIHRMLKKQELDQTHTGPQYRPIFKAARLPEPERWPRVDEWLDTLTMPQASQVIGYLAAREGR